jgi:hypothetical protein
MFYAWQQKWATKKVLLIFSLLFLIFPLYLLPQILPEGRPLDLYLYYSVPQAISLLESYGPDNRAIYLTGLMTIDIIYPLFYTAFLSLLLSYFNPNNHRHNHAIEQQEVAMSKQSAIWEYGLLCSLLLSDILENIAVISMLRQYPEVDGAVAVLASSFTSVKWLLFVVIFSLLLYRVVITYRHYRKPLQGSDGIE